ncbi:MAG: hypothetical protein QG639_353, partial [Patescibacteria group bacterium]|nr:hypothetical protein [Patescibacteria group bacterium]
MQHIVDLHIHSHYSRATSKDMNLSGIYKWGKLKGISIIGTGDITHPAWFREISERLEVGADGLYQLKKSFAEKIDEQLPARFQKTTIHFIPTVEISTIYSKAGKVRKIHQVIVLPDLAAASRMNTELATIGNLSADGRPILGLDSKRLLEIVLSISDQAMIIPAHIWTPWFGMFGSKSGFDSIQEAYEDLSLEIMAIETGLSSDPAMNWQIPELQKVAITSHSDAHSPQKLGREATLINCELSYQNIIEALKTNDERLVGTIEFYPQEGKYHYDGHRGCGVSFSPEESSHLEGICPVCGKGLTIGVENRVQQLSQPNNEQFKKNVEYIIPLTELIANSLHLKSTNSKKVQAY